MPTLPPPPTIPDHEMLAIIGQGSYGHVWRARSTLGTMRAVKVVWRKNFESDRPYEREFMGIKRFEPVSRSHEGLVDILQVGRNDVEGFFYYIMELADNARKSHEGESTTNDEIYGPRTLRTEIDRLGRLPAEACVDHFLNLAAALGHMHRLGLIHRDVKPSNIILVNGVAKLADVGLVAEMRDGGSFVGTEGYIPQEGPNSPQADLYSLGKTLYEAATGLDRMKFPTLPATGPQGLTALSCIMDLNAVAMKACMPDAAARYQSGSEMLVDLATMQSGHSVRELHRSAERLRFARRWGLIAAAAAAVAGCLGGFGVWRAREETKSRQSIEILLRRTEKAEQESSERLHGQALALARAECLSTLSGRRFRALDAIREAAKLRPGDVALRSQAITALAIPDFRETRRWPAMKAADGTWRRQCMAPAMDKYAQVQADGSVRILRVDDGAELHKLPAPPHVPDNIAFSPDGAYLLTWAMHQAGSSDAVIWNTATGQETLRIPGLIMKGAHGYLRFRASPPEAIILQDDAVAVFPLDGNISASRSIPLPSKKDILTEVKADRVLAGSRTNGRAYLVNLTTNNVEHTLPHLPSTFSFGLNEDASMAAISGDGSVSLHDPAGNVPPLPLPGRYGGLFSMEFDLLGEVLLTASWDGASRLFGCADQTLLATHPRAFSKSIFHAANKFTCIDANLDILEAEWAGREACRVFRMPVNNLGNTACFAAGGRVLLSSGGQGTQLTDAATLRTLEMLDSAPVRGFAMPMENGPMWVATTNGLFKREVARAEQAERALAPEQLILPGDAWQVAASADGSVIVAMVGHQLYVSQNGSEFLKWASADRVFRSLTLSQDGRWMATRGEALLVYDLSKQPGTAPERKWNGAGFSLVSFTADSRSLVISSVNGVRCEPLEPGASAWLCPHPSAGGVAACSPDGKMIAAADSSSSFLLLRPADGSLIARVEHHLGSVLGGLEFSPDGSQLLVMEINNLARVWALNHVRAKLADLQLDWEQ